MFIDPRSLNTFCCMTGSRLANVNRLTKRKAAASQSPEFDDIEDSEPKTILPVHSDSVELPLGLF